MQTKAEPLTDTAAHSNGENGALDRFITTFNQFETERELFTRCVDDEKLPWWDVVRYNLQFAIAIERGLVGTKAEKPAGLSTRLLNFLKHLVGIVRFLFHLIFTDFHKTDLLHVSARTLDTLPPPPLSDANQALYINKSAKTESPHQALSKPTFDFLIRLLTPLFRVPPEVETEADRIAGELKTRFDSSRNLQTVMLSKYKQTQASLWLWRVILKRLPQLKHILFVNDDTLRPLIFLARQRGIKTMEIQHGYMGKSHFAYSYPDLSFPIPTLPDEIWITRDTGDITFPVTKISAGKTTIAKSDTPRDIDVLIGGSPTRSEEMRDIVKALVDGGFSVAVKLHPAQTVESSGLRPLFSAEQVTIFDNREEFTSLAARSQLYVPANPTSTTVFEAVEAGADLIIVNYQGKKLTDMCDSIATDQVDSLEALGDAVSNHLRRRKM